MNPYVDFALATFLGVLSVLFTITTLQFHHLLRNNIKHLADTPSLAEVGDDSDYAYAAGSIQSALKCHNRDIRSRIKEGWFCVVVSLLTSVLLALSIGGTP